MNKEHEIVLYQINKTNICVSVFYEETFGLTQKAMADYLIVLRIIFLCAYYTFFEEKNWMKSQLPIFPR